MRRLIILALLLIFAAFALPVLAQEATPEPSPTPDLDDLAYLVLDTAQAASDRASDLINLFELVGGALTVILLMLGAIGIVVGLNRLNSVQGDLEASREKVNDAIRDSQVKVDSALEAARKDVDKAREDTQKALLDVQIALRQMDQARSGVEATEQQLRASLNATEQELKARIEAAENQVSSGFTQAQTLLDQAIHDRQAEMQQLEDTLRERITRSSLALSLLPLGERQYIAGDRDGAEETYEAALKLDPENPVTLYRLGYVEIKRGKIGEAIEHLEEALRFMPHLDHAKAALGFAYRRQAEAMPEGDARDRKMLDGQTLLREALMNTPNLVDDDGESWWGSLGGLHRRLDQPKQAIEAYQRAAAVTPHSSYPFGQLALLLMVEKRRDEMLQTYKRIEKLARSETLANLENYYGFSDLLTAQLAQGKVSEANETLEDLFNTAPKETDEPLESQIITLNRLLDALGGAGEAPHIADFIQKIREEIERRVQKRNAWAQ
jgi:tetratricopeptide (TPR) repeat protein